MAWRASVVIVETTDQIAVAVDEEVEITGFVVLEAETQASTAVDAAASADSNRGSKAGPVPGRNQPQPWITKRPRPGYIEPT